MLLFAFLYLYHFDNLSAYLVAGLILTDTNVINTLLTLYQSVSGYTRKLFLFSALQHPKIIKYYW